MKYREILMEPWGFSSRQCGIPPLPTQLVMLYWTFTISQMSGNVSVKSISIITIRFLEQGCEELEKLAQLHNLVDLQSLTCGAEVSWQSTDIIKVRRESQGLTLFGALGNLLYRDRGFATSKPVTADYYLSNPQTLCLRTEYNNSVFEEEIKLIGSKYRTRQSIISRAGEQLMIGQYLEKRI